MQVEPAAEFPTHGTRHGMLSVGTALGLPDPADRQPNAPHSFQRASIPETLVLGANRRKMVLYGAGLPMHVQREVYKVIQHPLLITTFLLTLMLLVQLW